VKIGILVMLMVNDPFGDEKYLLEQLRQGNSEAFFRLYKRYHKQVYHYLLKFIKSPEVAEDALQEAFIKIWEIRERINPALGFTGYLFRISRNTLFKLMKKMASGDALLLRAAREFQNEVNDPDTRLRWQQYEKLLREAVNQLPPQRKNVFTLCREEGKSYDQVSAELGISKNTVKEHMVASMKFLRDYISRHGDIALAFFLLMK
jgi:RNA polymerase sigma-70 factor (family 1)